MGSAKIWLTPISVNVRQVSEGKDARLKLTFVLKHPVLTAVPVKSLLPIWAK